MSSLKSRVSRRSSRSATFNLPYLKQRLKQASVTEKLLTVILRRPLQYVVDRLAGKKSFTYMELLSIADLLNSDMTDFFGKR